MNQTKKLLTLGVLSMGVIPLVVISCGTEKETTYFESENFRISSKGEMMGYADENFNHFGELEIKEKYNGVVIKHIANYAFKAQTGIDGVILPKTLVSIGGGAFRDIKSPVRYPSDQDINEPVLWDLSHLINLETIGGGAFANNIDAPNVQQNIVLNLSGLSKLKSIGGDAFYKRGISSVNFNGLSNLETIGEGAFAHNKLTSVNIPNSVRSIGEGAFSNNKLNSVNIPNSVTTIEGGAFYENQLSSVIIPNSVTTIGRGLSGAFGRNQLTSINIPNSVTSIGEEAFFSNQLASVIIPNSVTTIENRAFRNNPFTDNSKIILPVQFNTASERLRIGITLPLDANSPTNNYKIETLIPIPDNKRY